MFNRLNLLKRTDLILIFGITAVLMLCSAIATFVLYQPWVSATFLIASWLFLALTLYFRPATLAEVGRQKRLQAARTLYLEAAKSEMEQLVRAMKKSALPMYQLRNLFTSVQMFLAGEVDAHQLKFLNRELNIIATKSGELLMRLYFEPTDDGDVNLCLEVPNKGCFYRNLSDFLADIQSRRPEHLD